MLIELLFADAHKNCRLPLGAANNKWPWLARVNREKVAAAADALRRWQVPVRNNEHHSNWQHHNNWRRKTMEHDRQTSRLLGRRGPPRRAPSGGGSGGGTVVVLANAGAFVVFAAAAAAAAVSAPAGLLL